MTKNFEQSWKKEIKEMVAAEVTQGAGEQLTLNCVCQCFILGENCFR